MKGRKRYLFFVQVAYAYHILRPLQEEIWRRGDEVAWFLDNGCPNRLTERERELKSIDEVMEYNPIAIFLPSFEVYDFFPGVKVCIFHGYPIRKRSEKDNGYHKIRNWFDIYCTQGESGTLAYRKLEKKLKFFKVYETGWCRVDAFFNEDTAKALSSTTATPRPATTPATTATTTPAPTATPSDSDSGSDSDSDSDSDSASDSGSTPTILYATTFTEGVSSAKMVLPIIDELAGKREWRWILTSHPLLKDPAIIAMYEDIAERHENVEYLPENDGIRMYREADVMLSDSSSIMVEFMILDKPVVTFRNTHPGDYLIDVTEVEEIEGAIERALTHPAELMEAIRKYTYMHEPHRDGKNSARVLDAVDDYLKNYAGRLHRKPLNLFRKFRLRLRLGYWKHIF